MSDQRDLARLLETMSSGRESDNAPATDIPRPAASGVRPATPHDILAHVRSRAVSHAPEQGSRTAEICATLLPVAWVLALTLPLLGAGWFLLDPIRVIRTIPAYIPVGLIVSGLASGGVSVILWRGLTRSRPST